MQLDRHKLGATALEWCGYAYIYAFAWLVILALRERILAIPELGDSVVKILSWVSFVLLPAMALGALALGLSAAGHALATRGSARQALLGLLAAVLIVAGVAGLWWLDAVALWTDVFAPGP